MVILSLQVNLFLVVDAVPTQHYNLLSAFQHSMFHFFLHSFCLAIIPLTSPKMYLFIIIA